MLLKDIDFKKVLFFDIETVTGAPTYAAMPDENGKSYGLSGHSNAELLVILVRKIFLMLKVQFMPNFRK